MLLERRSNSISFCVDQTWRNKDSLGPAQFPVLCSVVVGSFIWGGGGMADSVQPTQRNLYQKGVTGTYRDGTGTLYTEQLKKLSWPISSDVPTHAQHSAKKAVDEGAYSTLHPMSFVQTREIDEPTFSETYGNFGIRSDVRRRPAHPPASCLPPSPHPL